MNRTFHYLLMANQWIFHRGVFRRLKDSGLTPGQPKVLDYLRTDNGASQKEIAEGCHIAPASLTAVLNGMEEKGLIRRTTMNGNRRTMHIFLTSAGEEKQTIVEEAFEEMEQMAFSGIAQDEKEQFLKTFEKIYHNVCREEGEDE